MEIITITLLTVSALTFAGAFYFYRKCDKLLSETEEIRDQSVKLRDEARELLAAFHWIEYHHYSNDTWPASGGKYALCLQGGEVVAGKWIGSGWDIPGYEPYRSADIHHYLKIPRTPYEQIPTGLSPVAGPLGTVEGERGDHSTPDAPKQHDPERWKD